MKKQVLKVIAILIAWIITVVFIINRTYADAQDLILSITTDKSSYAVGDDIEVKIQLNENVMTASYYLNYNSSFVTFKNVKTQSISTKDYPNDNLVRAVYVDTDGIGIKEMIFVFTLKAQPNENIKFNLTKTTMTVAENSKSYSQKQIGNIDTGAQITFSNSSGNIPNNNTGNIPQTSNKNNSGSSTEERINNISNSNNSNNGLKTSTGQGVNINDSSAAKTVIPKTGLDSKYIYLIITFILISIYLGYNMIKLGKYFKY